VFERQGVTDALPFLFVEGKSPVWLAQAEPASLQAIACFGNIQS
jgi:hypothetical protein